MPEPDLTEDSLLEGRVRLVQPRRGHRAGTDAVLLARLAGAREGDVVADLGAATGAVGLMIARLVPGTELVLVERDPMLAGLCERNMRANGLQERAKVVEADILRPALERHRAGLVPASADLVVTNPPYLDEGRSRSSPDEGRAAAHAMPDGGLDGWTRAALDLLKPKGRLALIHRADRLGDVLQVLDNRFGEVRIRAVHPKPDEPAIRILVTAVKGSRGPLALCPPLVLHAPDGRFTEEAALLHGGSD